jgi:hypothetical protein
MRVLKFTTQITTLKIVQLSYSPYFIVKGQRRYSQHFSVLKHCL